MKVLKFGGTSVGTVESLTNVKNIVESLDSPAIVVVSALGGLTDRLIATAKMAAEGNPDFRVSMGEMRERHLRIIEAMIPVSRQEAVEATVGDLLNNLEEIYTGVSLIRDLPDKTLDLIVSFGERMSSVIVANMIEGASHRDSLSFMKTEKWFDRNIAAREETESGIKATFGLPLEGHIVTGGFISRDKDTEGITNLGRGGSDYTAALIAAALDADTLEIWTDVDGFLTADPRIIPEAKVIDNMSFIESMELCSFGAKVIYPPTIYPVFHKNIPIKILNTHNPSAPGTLITDSNSRNAECVRGVSSLKNTALITVTGDLATNVAQINSRAFNAMARNGISVFLVAQPGREVAFSIALADKDAAKAEGVLRDEFAPELLSGTVKSITLDTNLAIVAIVRDNIKSVQGLGARLVNTLQRNAVEVKAVSDGASETTIALVVNHDDVDNSLRLIHMACFG